MNNAYLKCIADKLCAAEDVDYVGLRCYSIPGTPLPPEPFEIDASVEEGITTQALSTGILYTPTTDVTLTSIELVLVQLIFPQNVTLQVDLGVGGQGVGTAVGSSALTLVPTSTNAVIFPMAGIALTGGTTYTLWLSGVTGATNFSNHNTSTNSQLGFVVGTTINTTDLPSIIISGTTQNGGTAGTTGEAYGLREASGLITYRDVVTDAPVATTNLVKCEPLESDDSQWCVDNVQYTRTMMKQGGVPTGQITWTNFSTGAVTAAPLAGAASIKEGACSLPTVQQDQVHSIVHGAEDIPAGYKSVTITNLTGQTTVDGQFILGGDGPSSISYSATELPEVRGLLPAIALAGGTWQWTGILAVAEE